MSIRLVFALSMLAAASPAAAQNKPATAEAPHSYTIETPGTAVARPDLDTPIGQLIGDPRTKAVLDKDLPGLSDDSNLAKFRNLSLRQLQPLTGGQLNATLLQHTGEDLAALASTTAPTSVPEPASVDPAVEQKGAVPASASTDSDKPR